MKLSWVLFASVICAPGSRAANSPPPAANPLEGYTVHLTSIETELNHAWLLCSAVSSALDGVATVFDSKADNSRIKARIAKTEKIEESIFEDNKKLFGEIQRFLSAQNGDLYQYDFELNGVSEGGYLVVAEGRILKKWPILSGTYAYFSKPPVKEAPTHTGSVR